MLEAPNGLQGARELSLKGPTVLFGQNLEIVTIVFLGIAKINTAKHGTLVVGAVAMHSDRFACN